METNKKIGEQAEVCIIKFTANARSPQKGEDSQITEISGVIAIEETTPISEIYKRIFDLLEKNTGTKKGWAIAPIIVQ